MQGAWCKEKKNEAVWRLQGEGGLRKGSTVSGQPLWRPLGWTDEPSARWP